MQLSQFTAPFYTVMIASIDEKGYPFSSYAPFVKVENNYYTLMSDIAKHASNIQKCAKTSLLFIEDESKSQNLFARKRAVVTCDGVKIERDSERFASIMLQFIARQGEMAQMLIQMRDFNLYEFTPLYGEATFGFGEAYTLDTKDMDRLIPRGGMGHQK